MPENTNQPSSSANKDALEIKALRELVEKLTIDQRMIMKRLKIKPADLFGLGKFGPDGKP